MVEIPTWTSIFSWEWKILSSSHPGQRFSI